MINMYLIIGLGNPEPEYSRTRHNMGFDTINKVANKYKIEMPREKFEGIYGNGVINNEKVILLKPQTYMNLSGKSIKQFINFYKIPTENILVIYDDMDIDIGKIKIRKQGSAGSHNGMKSIVNELKTTMFSRIRIGIGKPKEDYEKINYVIGKIENEEYKQLEEGIDRAVEAVGEFIENGIDIAMNKYN